MYIATFIVVFIASAVICHFMAKARGLNPVYWGVMGGVFGPLTIFFIIFSNRTKIKKHNK